MNLFVLIRFLPKMAITTKLLTLRAAFMSAGFLSTALILKLSFPLLIAFLDCQIPYLCSVAVVYLKPPYLYLVLNCIIITIAASTKLQPQKYDADGLAVSPIPVQIEVQEDVIFADPELIKPVLAPLDSDSVVSSLMFEYVNDAAEKELPEMTTPPDEKFTGEGVPEKGSVDEEFVMPTRKRNPAGNYSVKPLVSQRFSNRKSAKASPEGGKVQLGVTKPRRQDTLESTWRMITEGRPVPLTRHLKKSDTWDTRDESAATSESRLMKKAETFNDHGTASNNESLGGEGGGSGRVRREPSLSQDELNRRVEAFIRKFNEEMKLQRLESLKQYSDMVGLETT